MEGEDAFAPRGSARGVHIGGAAQCSGSLTLSELDGVDGSATFCGLLGIEHEESIELDEVVILQLEGAEFFRVLSSLAEAEIVEDHVVLRKLESVGEVMKATNRFVADG